MTSSPPDVHAHVAAGAADAATLLATHAEAPPVCSITVEFSHLDRTPYVLCQLASTDASPLVALVGWVDALDEPSVTVTRYDRPSPFTSVSVHTKTGETPVRVWTHPGADEVAELWRAVGHEPESGVTAAITVDALRAAAESCRASRETDHDENAETSTETEGAA